MEDWEKGCNFKLGYQGSPPCESAILIVLIPDKRDREF